MATTKAQQRAVSKYMANNYQQVVVRMRDHGRDAVQAHAASTGESVNAFMLRAIRETMQRDQEKHPEGYLEQTEKRG